MAKSFQEAILLQDSILMIVDTLNLAFRWKHKNETDFLEEYLKTIQSLRRFYKAKHVILAADSGASSYRKALYPEYKQNRKDKQALQTPEEEAYFLEFFEEYLNILDAYKESNTFPVFRFTKTEADDIAAYIVKTMHKYPKITKIVLISSDRDWDLLIKESVMRFSYVTTKEVTWENWKTHYDCEPEQYISIKCLQGDSGDNILGVDGIGPVKAAALVNEFGSTWDIIAHLPIESRFKHIKNLNTFGKDNLILNYKLMDLLEFCEEALGPTNCAVIDNELEKYLNE